AAARGLLAGRRLQLRRRALDVLHGHADLALQRAGDDPAGEADDEETGERAVEEEAAAARRRLARLLGALLEELLLLRLRVAQEATHLVHGALAGAGLDELRRGLDATGPADLDGLAEEALLLLDERLGLGQPLLLARVVGGELDELLEGGSDRGGRL